MRKPTLGAKVFLHLLCWFLLCSGTEAQTGSSSPLPSIGVVGQNIETTIKSRRCRGVRLVLVEPHGSAYASGLRTNDIILSIDERVVSSPDSIRGILELESGKTFRVVFARPKASQFELRKIFARWSFLDQLESQAKPPDEARQLEELESLAYSLVERDRAANGLSARLVRSKKLSEFARQFAREMGQSQIFSHTDGQGRDLQERASAACIGQINENLAFQRGCSPRFLIQQCQKNFMSEPVDQKNHRSNILDPNNRTVGVGVAFLKDGGVLLVQEFSHFDIP